MLCAYLTYFTPRLARELSVQKRVSELETSLPIRADYRGRRRRRLLMQLNCGAHATLTVVVLLLSRRGASQQRWRPTDRKCNGGGFMSNATSQVWRISFVKSVESLTKSPWTEEQPLKICRLAVLEQWYVSAFWQQSTN